MREREKDGFFREFERVSSGVGDTEKSNGVLFLFLISGIELGFNGLMLVILMLLPHRRGRENVY